MATITRTDFHFNFLKNVIIRIDFQGVFEPEMERLLTLIKPVVKGKGFSRYLKKQNNQIKVDVENLNSQDSSLSKVVQSQEIHSFVNEDRGYVLDLASSFVCLNINSTSYTPFEDYSSLVSEIAKIYKNNIDFASINRVGIRKMNVCMFEDREKIKEFFSPEFFGYFKSIPGAHTFTSRRQDIFGIDLYKVNLSCNIEQGTAAGKTLYRVLLDSDIYVDNAETIKNGVDFLQMNRLLFDIYVSSLTEKFIVALCGDDESKFEGIIGVEKNE